MQRVTTRSAATNDIFLSMRADFTGADTEDGALANLLRILFNAWFGIVMAIVMLKYIYFGDDAIRNKGNCGVLGCILVRDCRLSSH